jgi:hypothetical protein
VRVRVKCPKCQKTSEMEIPAPVQSKGGKARMAKITPEERQRNAQKAAQTRRRHRKGDDTECQP